MNKRLLCSIVLAASLAAQAARAHTEVSEASALSMLPVAVSVAAPSMVLGAGAVLTVVSIQASAIGTVWVLERASDGARATLHFSGHVAQGAALSIGGAVARAPVAITAFLKASAVPSTSTVPGPAKRALPKNTSTPNSLL